MSEDCLILLFTRVPELGKVKTRLAEGVGPEKALEVHSLMLQNTLMKCKKTNSDFFVFCPELPDSNVPSILFGAREQRGEDLGEKMKNAFDFGFKEGYKRILIIGSDCPELTISHLESAFELLKTNDLVIGPARDGGYYLLGMNKKQPSLFSTIEWSTTSVFRETFEIARKLNLSISLMPILNDIDTEDDLMEYELKNGRMR